MFKIIFLILFLNLLYIIVKKEKRGVKFTLLTYFTLLTVVFAIGLWNISTTYQLNYSPVEGGFQKLMGWVSVFGYLYLLPLFVFVGYKLFIFSLSNFRQRTSRIVMFIIMLMAAAVIGYGAYIFFILLFYGFAP